MADDKNMNDDLFGADEDQDLDAQNDMDEEYEDDEVEEDSDEFDPETGENHTLSLMKLVLVLTSQTSTVARLSQPICPQR